MHRLLNIFLLVLCATGSLATCTIANAQQSELSKGPLWIKKQLHQNGVLNTPLYSPTKEYDSHKKYANISGLFFSGLPFKGKQTRVFCWYGIPLSLENGQKAPAVVLVHGGGGTVYPEWVKEWTDRGYIAISVGLEGQVPGEKIEKSSGKKGWPTIEYSGPSRRGFFEDVVTENLHDQWFYHAVADVMMATSLLKSFPEVDGDNIGISGISWGGILTNVITGIDARYAFAIPVYGCGFLGQTPNYKNLLSRLTREQQQFYLENWEPSLYLPLQKQPTLFVNGTNDFHFTMNSFTKTYEASKNEKYLCVAHNMRHGHKPGWEPKEIYAFADYITKNTAGPIKLKINNSGSNHTPVYEYEGALDRAFLYYTTDVADWGSKNYTWTEAKTKIDKNKKTIKIKLPKDTKAYFINTMDDNGFLSSSPMKLVGEN